MCNFATIYAFSPQNVCTYVCKNVSLHRFVGPMEKLATPKLRMQRTKPRPPTSIEFDNNVKLTEIFLNENYWNRIGTS